MKKMKKFKNLIIAMLAVIILVGCGSPKQKENEWIQLFNGKDLEGWTPKVRGFELGVNYKNTFRVEDGLLKVRYDEYDDFDNRFAHLFYKDEFSHYIIRVEYRFVGEQVPGGPGWAFRNNGIMIHGQSAESMEVEQDFPTSIEVQLLGGDGAATRPTANLCTPGTNVVLNGQLHLDHCTNSTSDTFHGDQWVTVEIEVHGGDVIKHFVNGVQVMEYSEPQLDERDKTYAKLLPANGDKIIRKGTISLQGESHPTDFRKIELKVLQH
jgi:hypothetical protein